jgi:F420H(2)-dependent quinone reductase
MHQSERDAMEGLPPRVQRYVRRGNRMAQRHPKGGRVFSGANRALIRLTRWRLGGSMQGVSIGLLTTTGRRSGRARTVPVVCFDDGSSFLVAGSNSGLDSPPAWCLNLRAQPHAQMRTRAGAEPVVAHELTGSEREAGWSRLAVYNPALIGYQACTERRIAVFALERSKKEVAA